MNFIGHQCHFILLLKFPQREPLHAFFFFFFFLACSHHSLGTFLVSGNTKYSQLILYFLHPAVKADFPSRNNGYFHWRKVFKNYVCSLLLIFLMGQTQELREISHMYIKRREISRMYIKTRRRVDFSSSRPKSTASPFSFSYFSCLFQ